MRRVFACALLLWGATIAAARAEGTPEISKDKLLELAVHPPKVAYSGKKLVVSWYGEKSRAREIKVYYEPPNRWRHEVLDPSGAIVKTTIQNGAREWVIGGDPDVILERDVRKIRDGALDGDGLKSLLAENFEVTDAGAREYLGVASRGVILSPRSDAGSRRVLWVDPTNGIVMHRRQSNHSGKSLQESRVTHLEIQKDLPDELFAPPAGEKEVVTEMEREEIGSPKALTKYGFSEDYWRKRLPFGYRLDTVRAIPVAKEAVAHLRYSNGLSLLSVFLSPYAIDAPDFPMPKEEDDSDAEFTAVSWAGNFLSWKTEEHYILVIGDLSDKRLKVIKKLLLAAKD